MMATPLRLLPPLLMLGCSAPNTQDLFLNLEVFAEQDETTAADHLIEVIDNANTQLDVALPAIEDTDLSDAIVAAWDRGVDVRALTDVDRSADAGVLQLQEAGVPLTLADGPVGYFEFIVGDEVNWRSDQTHMTHAFAVADQRHIASASSLGTLAAGERIVFSARGEELAEDLLTEHNQVFGGADATSTTAYSSLAKSIADSRWRYETSSDLALEVWFGPQERLTKRVIDAIYSARTSIRILTPDFSNDGMALALQTKAQRGFDVEIVIGPAVSAIAAAATSDDTESMAEAELRNVLLNSTPDLRKLELPSSDATIPTIVLIDLEAGPAAHPRVMVLSHALYASARLRDLPATQSAPNGLSEEIMTDQLIDGSLWTLDDRSGTLAPEIELLKEVYQRHADLGVPR
jgi:sugar-specific transcriptional regulator TrmB